MGVIMTDFANLGNSELNQIVNKFDIAHFKKSEPMKEGQVNYNYLLETEKEKYVLTIFNKKNYDEIITLVGILEHLSEKKFPSSKLVETVNGDLFDTYQKQYVIMKKYIEGEIIENLNEKQLFKVGKILAELHNIDVPSFVPDKYPYGIESFEQVYVKKAEDEEYIKWLQKKEKYLKENISNGLPKVLIHGDVFYDNLLWKNGMLAALIDFEYACNYYKIFDIGTAIIGNCIENEKINFQKAKSIIKGYRTLGRFDPKEIRQLKLFTEYAAIATSVLRFKLKGLINEKKSRDYKEMMRTAENIHNFPKKEFIQGIFY